LYPFADCDKENCLKKFPFKVKDITMIQKILVAVDGSAYSLRAALLGAKILHPNPSGILTLLHIAKPQSPMEWFQGAGSDIQGAPDKERQALERALAEGHKILKETEEALSTTKTGETFKTEKLVVPGEPAAKIVETAEAKGSELIIMGCRGLGGIRKVLLGSVSEKVLSLSRCPVLVVK